MENKMTTFQKLILVLAAVYVLGNVQVGFAPNILSSIYFALKFDS